MTTPIKQYQNVSYKELISYAENNINRTRALVSIDIQPVKAAQETVLDHFGLKGYTATNLNPSGILSVFSCIADPSYYTLSPKNIRTQLNIDLSTTLQQQTDDLKNTSIARKRKKIYDLIGAAYNGSAFQDKDYFDLYNGLSHMCNTQFVLMKEAVQENIEDDKKQYDTSLKGEIIFSSDPSNWKQEHPVWVADYRGRWVAIPSELSAESLHTIIGSWLSSMEQKGWIVQWPEVDATKTELVQQLSILPTWQETDKKLVKDVLAVRLGRANSLNVFTRWSTS